MPRSLAAVAERKVSAPKVLVVSGSVGAGHDGVARELARRLTAAGAVAQVRDFLTALPRPIVWLRGRAT